MTSQPVAKRVRHNKRGTEYDIIGEGRAQGSLSDEDPVVLYRGVDDGGLWVRHQAEFSDGRFEYVGIPTPSETEKTGGWMREKIAGVVFDHVQIGGTDWDRNSHGATINANEIADRILALLPDHIGEPTTMIPADEPVAWSLIDSVPFGQDVLLGSATWDSMLVHSWRDQKTKDYDLSRWGNPPTHWRPLPEPLQPATKDKGETGA